MSTDARSSRPRGRPYHHGDLRRALVDAVLRLSAERGVGSVSFREIARAAGVSQTAPYRHFDDLQALLAAAAEEGFVALRVALSLVLERSDGDPPITRLERMVGAHVQFAVEHPGYFRLMFGAGSPPRSVTPSLQSAARDTFQLFLAAVRAAWPARGGAAEARRGALQLWTIAHGIATLALDGHGAFLGLRPDAAAALARETARMQVVGASAARRPRTLPRTRAERKSRARPLYPR